LFEKKDKGFFLFSWKKRKKLSALVPGKSRTPFVQWALPCKAFSIPLRHSNITRRHRCLRVTGCLPWNFPANFRCPCAGVRPYAVKRHEKVSGLCLRMATTPQQRAPAREMIRKALSGAQF
jgi:hypothetical protein